MTSFINFSLKLFELNTSPFISCLLLLIFINACAIDSLKVGSEKPQINHWFTSCEKTEKIGKSSFFSDGVGPINANAQICDSTARSGSKSLLLNSNQKYAFTTVIKDVKAGDFFLASVWVKKEKNLPKLVGKYNQTHHINEKASKYRNGWSYIETKIHVIEGVKEIKFYIYHPQEENLILDDFHIYRVPNYIDSKIEKVEGIEFFEIEINEEEQESKIEQRNKAYLNRLQFSETKKWSKSKVNSIDAKMRFKGDWLDHLSNYKWSYRIKQELSNSFSITNPVSRSFLKEFVNQEIMRSQGLLTTNYRYCYVSFNDSLFGIYGLEDHFSNELIKKWGVDSGNILKYDEDHIWLIRHENKCKDRIELNYLDCAGIESFTNKKNKNQLKKAGQTMDKMKFGDYKPNYTFDIDYMARYFAFIDLFQGYHGTIWHNLRFYRNSKNEKFYPIAFDLSADKDKNYNHLFFEDLDHPQVFTPLFNNKIFKLKYIDYLTKYSSIEFIESTDSILGDKFLLYKKAFYNEYDSAWIKTDYLSTRAKYIREKLRNGAKAKLEGSKFTHFIKSNLSNNYQFHPKLSVKAYNQGNNEIIIQNFFHQKIKIVKLLDRDENLISEPNRNIAKFKKAGTKYPYLLFKNNQQVKYVIIMVGEKEWKIKVSKTAYPISF